MTTLIILIYSFFNTSVSPDEKIIENYINAFNNQDRTSLISVLDDSISLQMTSSDMG
jgi:uncharacterized membrane protein YvbJ